MNRTSLTLIGAGTALAALTGVAALAAPGAEEPRAPAAAAARKPVERSTVICPQPTSSDVAETIYTAFTPKGTAGTSGSKGGAELYPVQEAPADGPDGPDAGDDTGESEDRGSKQDGRQEGKQEGKQDGKDSGSGAQADPVLPLKKPGTPVTSTTSRSDAPALAGAAEGRLAPGWTVQQTTEVSAGAGRGLHGAACSAPDTDFWFPTASTAEDRQDYVHLTNPDDTAAVVDLDLFGKDGAVSTSSGEGITVPPRSTVPVLLSTLTTKPVTNASLHVVARTGRVGAQLQALDEKLGGDWIARAAGPAPSAVMPGIPADATAVRLVVHAPGERDADLKVRLVGANGRITPAGHETLHVKSGMTSAVDLKHLTQGRTGTLELTPSDSSDDATPVVAGVRVTRGNGGKQETAFIPATRPLTERATAADNRGRGTTLALTATDGAAKVRVTSSAGSEGGSPARKTYEIKDGTTESVVPPRPDGGKGTYAVTVERLSGGRLYASRMLSTDDDGLAAFTVQTLPDDGGTVSVPRATQDLSVLTRD